jgi:hypothetical protein
MDPAGSSGSAHKEELVMITTREDHFHQIPGANWQDGAEAMPMVRPGPMQPMPWVPRAPMTIPGPGAGTVPPGVPLGPRPGMPMSIPGGPPAAVPPMGMPPRPFMGV